MIRQLVLTGEVSSVAAFGVLQNSVFTHCPNRQVTNVWAKCIMGKKGDCGCKEETVLEVHGLDKVAFVKVRLKM